MGNFSIVFKNSLQNKKTPCLKLHCNKRQGVFRRLSFHNRCAAQPEAKDAILASARVITVAPTAAFLVEGDLEELEACAFRQGGCTLRQPRPSVLCNVQDVVLIQLNADPVGLHLEPQDARHHFRSVHVADGRLNVRRNFIRVDLLHPNKIHGFQRKHGNAKRIYNHLFGHNTLSFSRASQFGGLTEFHKKNFRTIYIILHFT